MFPQFKKLNNESGVVLFIVLMTAIIIMIFSVGILIQSINETNYAQQQIDQIVSEQLAKGIFWNAYSNAYSLADITNLSSFSYTNTMNGRTYQVSVNYQGTGPAGCPSCTNWSVTSNYDTFQ